MGYRETGRLLKVVRVALFASLWLILFQATRVQADGSLFVADQTAGTIHQYSLAGDDLGVFARGLNSPSWITADGHGNIYVSEYQGDRVIKYSPSGEMLLTIATSYTPSGVRVGRDGTIYVGSYSAGRVNRYGASGQSLGIFVELPNPRVDFITFDRHGFLYGPSDGIIWRVSPEGEYLGPFVSGVVPEGIAFDSIGNLYAPLQYNDTPVLIKKYSRTGSGLGTFATTQPSSYGLAVDKARNLYVANYSHGTIEKFSPSGENLGAFVSTGLSNPRDLVVVEISPEPDLVEISITNPPATATRLSGFPVTDAVSNQGPVSASPSVTRYYLSTDQVKDGGDERLIGSHPVPALASGATDTKTVMVTIPFNTQPGMYYLLACADDKNRVGESDEDNNCLASMSTIQVLGR
jgi:sugar lactone lactonase YvrE